VNIVIVGAGPVGVSLATYLIKQHHHISIIERDPVLCNDLNTKMDVFVVNGPGTRPSVLESADIRNADMLIAVTPSDDTNLVLCNFARQYGVEKRIARIKSSEYFSPDSPVKLTELGVTHLIETEKEVVKNIMQYIEFPQATQTANFHSDSVYLRGFKVLENMQIANKTLFEIKQFTSLAPMLVVAIIRGNDTVLPTGEIKLLPGDEAIVMMPRESFKGFQKLVNSSDEKVSRVIVYGDSLIAIHLAQELKNLAETVNFIDPNIEHAKKAASVLKGLDVITGNCTNADIFQEIRVQNADFFISVVEDDDDNIMSCLLAKAEGARRVMAVRNDQRHVDLFLSLGVDHIINPQDISTQKIIEDIKAVPIENHLMLKNGGIEVMRFRAGKNSRIIKKPLKDLQGLFKRSIIVGTILRENDVFIPKGDTLINEGDEVFVLYNSESTKYVHRLFKSSML
jgi:trk system potassium uptake protein TrkA